MVDLCEFVTTEIEPGQFHQRCAVCGFTDTTTTEHFVNACRGPKKQKAPRPAKPPLLKRLANFSKAAITHAMNGAPTCTEEQIAERFAICKGCDIFQPDADNPEVGVCTHSSCGCPVTRANKFVSKLAWADQEC